MKKYLTIFIALILVVLMLSACNRTIIDTHYTFKYGYIELPTGEVIEGKISSWTDYDQSDQIQVTINGKTYWTHISRVVLVDKGGE